ncbi:hypothetical protein GQR58_006591 [Nymphon striatum]|nr:hypothetical protein GQR58_006591 [Nymphon striatum]
MVVGKQGDIEHQQKEVIVNGPVGGLPTLPTLPNVYSATYEYTYGGQMTLLMQEEYDGHNQKFSLTEYLNGEMKTLYETGGKQSQIFSLSKGQCNIINRADLNKSDFLKRLRKLSPKIVKDKNIYLKLLVELPKTALKGYAGRENLPVNNITVDHWVYCLDGKNAVQVYWSVPLEKTQAAHPYPVQVTIDYEGGFSETVYIFKYLDNQINETAIDPPESIYCEERHSNRQLNTSLFIGKDMEFTTEVVNPHMKTITTSKHSYALDEKVVMIRTLNPNPKKGQMRHDVRFVFDLNLGYYFEVDDIENTCVARPIAEYIDNMGDLFQIQKGMLSNQDLFGKEVPYYFDKKAWTRGIRTNMYKGFRSGYPPGISNVDSVINWYMVERNERGELAPVALEFFLTKTNTIDGKILEKITFDLFDWISYTNYNSFAVDYVQVTGCSKSSDATVVKVSFSYPALKYGDSIPQLNLRRTLNAQFAKVAKISILRIQYGQLDQPDNNKIGYTFYLYPEFKGVPESNVTNTEAFTAWKTAVNNYSFRVSINSTNGTKKKLVAVTNSITVVERN